MFETDGNCPYIGLRPFSEDDSIYFKGRDEHVLQVAALLEVNKFLMVTGASGDGKSSLVYAGLIPNARAGFFRANYNNWVVADFRPERSPLKNLARSLTQNLRLESENSVETELRRGFSSLVDLYKTSSLFIDENSKEWTEADPDKRGTLKRDTANLLIVADQFEEFFTNPENYYRNQPSADAQLVVNLLLETARLALDHGLPIYVVCTMRSDYIGQCAAFRGLPEFIGFSQFFVPRLKRKDMEQVVEDPAHLNGNRISHRLVQRVVYDLEEGIDQLPVLEHAMNEVWHQAQESRDEMDLIHYAKVGGMPVEELPEEDRIGFNYWFRHLSPKVQSAFQHPGLARIIDTHANRLYLTAADQYNQKYDNKINQEDAKLIIRGAFICLTKMDQGRAVRNRMTLEEITRIINRPHLGTEVVGRILNIFREPGNTFVRPYITDDPETHKLSSDTVLDITHESLIRNWELLKTWANDEYDHLITYQDFKKQLDRWLESGKSRGFLLPIGPLTYFENWYEQLKPNKYWINRYLDPDLDPETRIRQATEITDESREFLKRSARKHIVTRTVVKYGALKIAVTLGLVFILGLCGFYYNDARLKQNEYVVREALAEGSAMVGDPVNRSSWRTVMLLLAEKMEPGAFRRILDGIPEPGNLALLSNLYLEILWHGGTANPPLRKEIFYYADSLFQAAPLNLEDPKDFMLRLRGLNMVLALSTHHLYFNPDQKIENIRSRTLSEVQQIILQVLTNDHDPELINMGAVNDGMEHLLNFQVLSEEDIEDILNNISPFENSNSARKFDQYYPPEGQVLYSRWESISHNGGYQQLAYLYAVLGNVDRVQMCVDSLTQDHDDYFTFRNNIFNVCAYLAQYDHIPELSGLVEFNADKQRIPKSEFYEMMLNRSGFADHHMAFKVWGAGENHNLNLELLKANILENLFNLYHGAIVEESTNANDLNFNLALYFKHRGVILYKHYLDRGMDPNIVSLDSLFGKSVDHFRKVSSNFLHQTISITERYNSGNNQVVNQVLRKNLFLYPDHYQKVYNNRQRSPKYFSSKFWEYLVKNNLFEELYAAPQDFDLINTWVMNYDEFDVVEANGKFFRNYLPLDPPILIQIDSVLSFYPAARGLNSNLIRLLILNYHHESGNYEAARKIYEEVDVARLRNNLEQGYFWNQYPFYHLANQMAGFLAIEGRKEEVAKVVESFSQPSNRIKSYAVAAQHLLRRNSTHKKDVFIYLDSAITEIDRMDDFQLRSADPRITLAFTLGLVGGKAMDQLARQLISKIPLDQQDAIMHNWINGIALSGDYYRAFSATPELSSGTERLRHLDELLLAEIITWDLEPEWQTYFDNRLEAYIEESRGYEPELF